MLNEPSDLTLSGVIRTMPLGESSVQRAPFPCCIAYGCSPGGVLALAPVTRHMNGVPSSATVGNARMAVRVAVDCRVGDGIVPWVALMVGALARFAVGLGTLDTDET